MANGMQQSGSAQAVGSVISAETRRRLSPVAFASSQTKASELPRDTVIKRCELHLAGQHDVTYSSGSPVLNQEGYWRLVPQIQVIIDGQRTVKSIDPYMQRFLNSLYAGNPPRRAYSSGSAAAYTTLLPATEWVSGTVAYPSTTQFILINECIVMHFEMPWAYSLGREATMLNIKDVSSAEIRYSFASMDQIQRDETSPVSVTYANIDINITPTIIEARAVPRDQQFFDFKETVTRFNFTGEVRDSEIQLPRGNALAGIAFKVRNGSANRNLVDRGLRDIQLQVNGQQVLQRTTFHELQDDNQARYGMNDVRASSRHAMEGLAFMNLLINGRIDSALNTTLGAGVDQVRALVTTAPASGTDANTYTNPLEVSVWSQEIAAVPAKA